MNSDINNPNPEFLSEQILIWIQPRNTSNLTHPQSPPQQRSNSVFPDESGEMWELKSIDTLIWEEDLEMIHPDANEMSQPSSFMETDDLPIAEHRFQTLLKQKLQTQIQQRPPYFPWETSLSDYEEDIAETVKSPWIPQLTASLSISLPEDVLTSLLKACSEAMATLRPSGAKMVQAVSDLFPNNASSLNSMANRMLMSPSRSSGTLEEAISQRFSGDYKSANAQQQMALSLLTAKKIIDALTLTLSPSQTLVQREWETTTGKVAVKAIYSPKTSPNVQVQVQLPQGGRLIWQTAQDSTTKEREDAGMLEVAFEGQAQQTYCLTIRLADAKESPLNFALEITK